MNSANASEPIVQVLAADLVELTAGGQAEARVTVRVADGYHVQANPSNDEFVVPLSVELRGRGGVRAGKPVYPAGRPYRLPGLERDWLTYEGTFQLHIPLRADAQARSGSYELAGVLQYQACSSQTCLFPSSVTFSLPVRVPADERSASLR